MIAHSALLTEIYNSGLVKDESGKSYPLNSEIYPEFADALYRTVLLP